ncbi:MAG: 1-deoxy-D-xylulose-5-phosphate reductoisomerase [Gammaproteobacteria bacterium]|nr:1-deoxy-D-xylulose-5-phosphate reductoisomerase [Gammaproteobacteria bacterium]
MNKKDNLSGQQAVTILGSTGSIGVSTLDVIARHPERYVVWAITAHSQVDRLYQQCIIHKPRYAVMVDPQAANALTQRIQKAGLDTVVKAGLEGLKEVASMKEVGTVMAAIVGAAGLEPTLEAVKAGKRVLLANKEPLVMCGHIFIEQAEKSGAVLLPIDSEHNAIFQCMPPGYHAGAKHSGIRKILLTGSGGPFRQRDPSTMTDITPDQACAHPNWSMGRKISVDSATLMNKGLELIEACWLFNVMPDKVQIIIHPQSIIHSMVEYLDGSVLAQLGNPDMRTPIAHALAWPDRIESGVEALDLFQVAQLDFEQPDFGRFPCLALCYRAAEAGGTLPAILNAANEVAVQSFLDGQISFLDISRVIEHVMNSMKHNEASSLQAVLDDDAMARKTAMEFVQSRLRVINRA